ncbi:thioredoxin family protein [Vaginella massiliensis]|uniref:thioredoxin family protein n=1 Tax=Vaginella massiliensis TaxID=1816680 RepID=UPI000838F247|nr:thioredoxin family protein [Vaginella massiliensis]
MKWKLMIGFWMSILPLLVQAQETMNKRVYNPEADAKTELANAVAKAKESNKHVLVQVGGNWCAWCITFNHLTTTNEELSKFIGDNYEVVHLNHSKENRNLEILAELKNPQRFGFPVFLIVDGDGNLLHTQNSAYLENKDGSTGHDPKLVLDFLKGWTYTALDPNSYKK